MPRRVIAVLLAGRMRPSPLREALDIPVLCLPVGERGTLLHAWLNVLDEVEQLEDVQVVVNNSTDVDLVEAVGNLHKDKARPYNLRIVPETAPWRGAAGILRDVVNDVDDDVSVLVCEAKRLPPHSLVPMLSAFEHADANVAGVVGVCGRDEPAGVYVFAAHTLNAIPRIGYFDMKEQFLPSLSRRNEKVITARLGDAVWRMPDLPSYLAAVHVSLKNGSNGHAIVRSATQSSVSPSAVLDGFCIIEPGAVVEDGAVIHNSVILRGATVGGGAVVSRSVVGPLTSVAPRTRVIQTVVNAARHRTGFKSPNRQFTKTPTPEASRLKPHISKGSTPC